MATRYSGDLKITIVYDDRGFYRSSISRGGRKLWRGNVRPPPIGFGSGVSYDSEKAYDKMAEAALSFADNDKPGLGEAAEYGQDGFKIRRVKGYWEQWPGGQVRPKRFSRDASRDKFGPKTQTTAIRYLLGGKEVHWDAISNPEETDRVLRRYGFTLRGAKNGFIAVKIRTSRSSRG